MNFHQLHTEVIAPGLCVRCGLCSGICPAQVITVSEDGFPHLTGRCTECGLCSECCPGADIDFPALSQEVFNAEYNPIDAQGHTDKLSVSYAGNSVIRDLGTSGGVVTALLVHLLEQGEIDGAVVAGMDTDSPCRSMGILATTPEEIKSAAMSKYCITPSLVALREIRKRKGRFAVAGLPCQVQGLRKLAKADPTLSAKIVCIIGLYCNCNMERHGHLEALQACHLNPRDVHHFQFRGGPWPGGFHIVKNSGEKVALHRMRYSDLINVMFRLYGAKRCYLCHDALSEYADISCGDFHAGDYSDSYGKLTGCTLVSERTLRGKQFLDKAEKAGALITHNLPTDRMSKRIISMAKGKKSRCVVRLRRRLHKRQPLPNYHFELPESSSKAKRSELFYRFFLLLRGQRARTFILKLLFSPLGEFMARLNVKRKKMFCNYHGN